MDSLRFSIFLINGIISFISLWLCVPKSFVIIPILSSYHKAINLLWLFSVRLGLFVSLLVYKRIKSLSASKTRIVIVSLFVYEFKLKIYDQMVNTLVVKPFFQIKRHSQIPLFRKIFYNCVNSPKNSIFLF